MMNNAWNVARLNCRSIRKIFIEVVLCHILFSPLCATAKSLSIFFYSYINIYIYILFYIVFYIVNESSLKVSRKERDLIFIVCYVDSYY